MKKIRLLAYLSLAIFITSIVYSIVSKDIVTDWRIATTIGIAIGGILTIHYLLDFAIGLVILPFLVAYKVSIWILASFLTIISFGRYRRTIRIIEEEQLRYAVRKELTRINQKNA